MKPKKPAPPARTEKSKPTELGRADLDKVTGGNGAPPPPRGPTGKGG